jgi:hypothetical protein
MKPSIKDIQDLRKEKVRINERTKQKGNKEKETHL